MLRFSWIMIFQQEFIIADIEESLGILGVNVLD